MHNHNCESVGEGQFIMTTVYNHIRTGAFFPINPSPTTLCVCHSGFLIVSEYFPDDWCINCNINCKTPSYIQGVSINLSR